MYVSCFDFAILIDMLLHSFEFITVMEVSCQRDKNVPHWARSIILYVGQVASWHIETKSQRVGCHATLLLLRYCVAC